MQLVGLNPNEKTSVNIDPNCLSCLKSSANQQEKTRVLNAFKLACLSYQPSRVVFQTESFNRSDLISRTRSLLDKFSSFQDNIDKIA